MTENKTETIETDFSLSFESLLRDLLQQGSLSEGLVTLLPAANADLFGSGNFVLGTERDDFLPGTEADDVILAGGGNDAIVSRSGNNVIFTTDALARGGFERDYVNISAGNNVVVLGDENGSYYTTDGWFDSVYIDGFEMGADSLVLYGSSDLYEVRSDEKGSWILWGDDASEAIAYLNGISNFSLNSNTVSFITSSAGLSSNSEAEPVQLEPVQPEPVQLEPESPFSQAFYQQLGQPEYAEVAGGVGDDLLVGSDRADSLAGFLGRDYAFGGGGADLFILGDFGGAYYTRAGWSDSLYIDDFTAGEDQIQLSGSVS